MLAEHAHGNNAATSNEKDAETITYEFKQVDKSNIITENDVTLSHLDDVPVTDIYRRTERTRLQRRERTI